MPLASGTLDAYMRLLVNGRIPGALCHSSAQYHCCSTYLKSNVGSSRRTSHQPKIHAVTDNAPLFFCPREEEPDCKIINQYLSSTSLAHSSICHGLRRHRFLIVPYLDLSVTTPYGRRRVTGAMTAGTVASYATSHDSSIQKNTSDASHNTGEEEDSIDIDDIQVEEPDERMNTEVGKLEESNKVPAVSPGSHNLPSSDVSSTLLATHKNRADHANPSDTVGQQYFRPSHGSSSSDYFLRLQHTRALLFSALCRGNQLVQSGSGKAYPPPQSVSTLARLAFFSTNFFSFSSGVAREKFIPCFRDGEGWTPPPLFLTARTSECLSQLLLEKEKNTFNCQSFGGQKEVSPDVVRSTEWKVFGSVFTATLRFCQDLPSHVPIALYLREGEPSHSSSSWSSSTSILTALSVHAPRIVEDGLSPSALFEQPHFRVCASHYLLTGALQGLSYSPFMQARLAQQLTPLEWLRESFRRLCANGKDEGESPRNPLHKEDENAEVDQNWIDTFIKNWNATMKEELPQANHIHQYLRRVAEDGSSFSSREDIHRCPLLAVLKVVVFQLHLLSSLEKSLISDVHRSTLNNRNQQRSVRLLHTLLSQVVLHETYFITVLPPGVGSITGTETNNSEMESKFFSALRVRKVKGLPALLRLAIPEVGRRCELFEQCRRHSRSSHLGHLSSELPSSLSMALSVHERETRQMREYLVSLLYELGALLPTLLHIEDLEEKVGLAHRKTASNGIDENHNRRSGGVSDGGDGEEQRESLPPTAGLRVVQALDDAWSATERMIETDGAESPMALWWLQAVSPLMHSFASLVERHQLQESLGVYKKAINTSGYPPASVKMADMLYLLSMGHTRGSALKIDTTSASSDSEEEWLVEQRVAAVLFELGWLAHRLIRYDRSAYERQVKEKAFRTTALVGEQSFPKSALRENTGEKKNRMSEIEHTKDPPNQEEEEEEEYEKSNLTTLPLPLAALRSSRSGGEGHKRSLFYTASSRSGGSSLLHLEEPQGAEEDGDILNHNDDIRLLMSNHHSKSSRFSHRRRSGEEMDKDHTAEYYCLDDSEGKGDLQQRSAKNQSRARGGSENSRHQDFRNTPSLLFRIFGLLSETTSTTLQQKYSLDTSQREGILEDAWVSILLALHRLSSTLRRQSIGTSVNEEVPSVKRITKNKKTNEEVSVQRTSIITAIAFAALPLSFFEAAHRLALSLSNILLEIEMRGSDQEAIGNATVLQLSPPSSFSSPPPVENGSGKATADRPDALEGRAGGVGGGSSSWATPARRRECRRQRAFLHMVLQVGVELLFHQSHRAEHLLQVWKLRHFGHCINPSSSSSLILPSSTDPIVSDFTGSDVIVGSVGASVAVHAMRDYQWATTTRNFASMLVQQKKTPRDGGSDKTLDDGEKEELEIQGIIAISKNTLECLGYVSTSSSAPMGKGGTNCGSLGTKFKSPFAKQALVHLLLTQLKQFSQIISRQQRRKIRSTMKTAPLELFSALLDVLTQDPELLLLCGSSPAFLDELCEVHLRFGLDRSTLVAFGDSVLLPTLLPLIVKALDVSAELGRHHVASFQAPDRLNSNDSSSSYKRASSISVTSLQHGEDCECILFLLAELSRFAVTPEFLSSVLRHRWNDMLLRVSVYCLQNTFRGGIKQPRFPSSIGNVSLSSIVSLLSVMEKEEPKSLSVVSLEKENSNNGNMNREASSKRAGVQANKPSATVIQQTLRFLFGYNDNDYIIFSESSHERKSRGDTTTEGTNVTEGLLAISLFRVGELHNGLLLRSRLSELVGQGWSAGSVIQGSGISTTLTAAAVTGLRAIYHAATVQPGFSFRNVSATLQHHRSVPHPGDSQKGLGQGIQNTSAENDYENHHKLLWRDQLVLAHQEALRQWCLSTTEVRRLAAQHRPFFAERSLQAYVMGYLIRFMEHYLREAERRVTSLPAYKRNDREREEENNAVLLSNDDRRSSSEMVTDTMLVSLQDTPAVLLELISYLTAGGGWAMVYWTLNAADIAMRIVKGHHINKHSANKPSNENEVRQIAMTAVLSQLRVIPAPLVGIGAGNTRRNMRYVTMLPTNFSKCCSALSDVLADESADTLLELPRRSKLSGLLARPTSLEECRVIMYAIKQAVIHLARAVAPFSRPSRERDRLQKTLAERRESDSSRADGVLAEDEFTSTDPDQEDTDSMYFSLSAIKAASGSWTKEARENDSVSSTELKGELSALNIGHKYYFQQDRGVAPSTRDFRQLLISLMCSLDVALQWTVQQRSYRRVVDSQVRLVAAKSLSCLIDNYLAEMIQASIEAVESGANEGRLMDDHAVLLWSGLCAAAMIGKVVELLDPKLDHELRTTLHSNLQHLLACVESLQGVIKASSCYIFDTKLNDIKTVSDGKKSHSLDADMLWMEVYRRGIKIMQRDPEISRRCLLRLGIDTFFTVLSSSANTSMQKDSNVYSSTTDDNSSPISRAPSITTTALARRGRGAADPPVDLLTVMQALSSLCPAAVLHPATASFFYDHVWLPLQRGNHRMNQVNSGPCVYTVTDSTLLRETLERLGTLTHARLEEGTVASKDDRVRWQCDTELWMRKVREGVSEVESASGATFHSVGVHRKRKEVEQTELEQEEEEWLLSHREGSLIPGVSRADTPTNGGDGDVGLWSSSPHQSRQNRPSYLYANLMNEVLEGDSQGEVSTDDAHQLTLEHVDVVDMQGRELQQLHRKQMENTGSDWMRRDSQLKESTSVYSFLQAAILFLTNVCMILPRFLLHELLVVHPEQRHKRLLERLIREDLHHLRLPPLRNTALESSRIISIAVFLHNLLPSIPLTLDSERKKLEMLLTDTWVLLESKWKKELIEPEDAFFNAAQSALQRRERAFRLSDIYGGSGGHSSLAKENKSAHTDSSRSSTGGRRRLKDLFALHPDDIDPLLHRMVGMPEGIEKSHNSTSPMLMSSIGFRVTSGLISADVVSFPRHDDIRGVVVAEAHKTVKGSARGVDEKKRKRVANTVALTTCLHPSIRPWDADSNGAQKGFEDEAIPLFVLLPLLKTLTFVRRGRQSNSGGDSSALVTLAEAIVTHACRRYVFLRPRLDGNNLNVSWTLWGNGETAQRGKEHRETIYRCVELPPLSLQVSSLLQSMTKDKTLHFSLFPPRISRMVKSLLSIGRKQSTLPGTVGSFEGEWLYDYLRDNALYLRFLTSLISVMCHFGFFEGGVAEMARKEESSNNFGRNGATAEEETVPSCLDQTLLHWLNVSSNYLRHVDTLCHLVMDLGGMAQLPKKESSGNNEGSGGVYEGTGNNQFMLERKLFLERLMFVEEMRQLASAVIRDSLISVVSATDQHSRRAPALQHAVHNLFTGFSCDSLLPQLTRNQEAQTISDEQRHLESPLGVTSPAMRHITWLQNEPLWRGKVSHYTSGSPSLMETLSSAMFIDQITPFMRVLSTHACANCIAASLSASIQNPLMELQLRDQHELLNSDSCTSFDSSGHGSTLLTPLLRSITTLVGGSSYPSWAARYTSVRLLCQTVAQQLVLRPDFRLALQPYSPLEGMTQTGSVPNDVLLSFLAVISRADVQAPPQALTALLELAMSLRPDVFGQPPVPSRHYSPAGQHNTTWKKGDHQGSASSLEELIQLARAKGKTAGHRESLLTTLEEEDTALILHNFTADRTDGRRASHANTLADLRLSLPATMELGLHLDAMRRLSSEEYRRAVGAIKAADEARRERVASILFPPSSLSHTGAVGDKEQLMSPKMIAQLAEAARLDVATELEKDDLNARLGVALLHLRFALRKVLHCSLRQTASCLPPPLLADVVELLGTVEGGVEAVEVQIPPPSSSSDHSAGFNFPFPLLGRTITFSQRAGGAIKWWQPPVPSSSESTKRHRRQSGDSMVSGTVRLLLTQAVNKTESLEEQSISSHAEVMVDKTHSSSFHGNNDASVVMAAGEGNDFALTARGRQRVAHIMSVLRRRRRMTLLSKLSFSTRH